MVAKNTISDKFRLVSLDDSFVDSRRDRIMIERQQLLKSIAATTADYRVDELGARTPEHIDSWIKQFDEGVQVPILREMDHVLKETYFPKRRVENFLERLLTSKDLAGEDPCSFWKNVSFLSRQGAGASQAEMLTILDQILKEHCGLGLNDCGKEPRAYVYLDDVTCTGNRIRRDIENWVKNEAPNGARLHIITIALHSGSSYADKRIGGVIRESGKSITRKWWYAIKLETNLSCKNVSDVLWPTSIPNESAVMEYVERMKHKPVFRIPGNTGTLHIFSNENERSVLEQQFLATGIKIKKQCPKLAANAHPLGYMILETLGFGTLIVTYRNCPNNAPLALWVDKPWVPLFPRKTNTQTEIDRMMEAF